MIHEFHFMILIINTILMTGQVLAPLVDLEVRGVPALTYFGDVVWKDVYDTMNRGKKHAQLLPLRCMMTSLLAGSMHCRCLTW
jgi:hypothetical protein